MALSSPPVGRTRRRGILGEQLQAYSGETVVEQREQDQTEPGHAENGGAEAQELDDDIVAAAADVNRIHDQFPAFFSSRTSISRADGQHEESQHEQQQAEQDQAGLMQAVALGELGGDRRRDRGARRKHRAGDAERVADDEGHRHGFAERAAERQHDAADHADARIGDHDVADDFPGGAADAVGGLLQHRRHGLEHVDRDRGDERQHHDREDQRRVEQAEIGRRAGEDRAQHRNAFEQTDHERLEVVGHERAEHEEAPHAVDDRGNAGEQLDGNADRAAQPLRAELGQEDRDAEADRHRNQHRDHRGDQRAVDRTERAEHRRIGRRRPARREQEGKAVFPDRRPRARDQRQDDAAEDQQNRDRAGAGDPVERNVAELEGAERLGAIVRSGSFHYVALNRHVRHANPL